jgi:hypothetical protein
MSKSESVGRYNEEREASMLRRSIAMDEEMDDDVSRKDSLYDTEQGDGKVAHQLKFYTPSVPMLAWPPFFASWYVRKLQRKRVDSIEPLGRFTEAVSLSRGARAKMTSARSARNDPLWNVSLMPIYRSILTEGQ